LVGKTKYFMNKYSWLTVTYSNSAGCKARAQIASLILNAEKHVHLYPNRRTSKAVAAHGLTKEIRTASMRKNVMHIHHTR
jgi:hypothetical protein